MNSVHRHMEDPPQADVAIESGLPARRLRPFHIYLILVAWTLFSVFLYSRYSQLGDSQAYLTGSYDEESQARTQLITWISTAVMRVVRSEFLVHMVFALFAATGVAYLVRQAGVQGRYCWPLLAIICNPNFGVWASVTGREPIFVGLLGFFMGAVIAYYHRPRLLLALLAIVSVVGMTFMREPYGMGMGLFLLMFMAYRSGPRLGLSLGVQALLLGAIGIGVLALAWPSIDRYITEEVLPRAKSYFTVYSATTRNWVHLQSSGDLFGSLWWSLPLAIIGPTPREAWNRPEMVPFLFSGLVVFATLLYSVYAAITAPAGRLRKILLLGWLPALGVVLITYIPFGVYNPGSAIRYASSFLLFVVFPSMLLSSVAAQAAPVVAEPWHWPRVRFRRRDAA